MTQEVVDNEVKPDKSTKPELDVDAIMARMEKLEATNTRLLEESKTNKAKYQGLRSEVEEKEKATLTENEQWKELLDIEKNKRSEMEQTLKNTQKTVLQKDLKFKVASIAKDAHDVNDVITALPKEMLSLDEENLTWNGVEEALNHVRENKPYFFNKETKSGMASGRPSVDIPTGDEDLSNEDLLKKALADFV